MVKRVRRRALWPFHRRLMFEDIEVIFREMEDLLTREFDELVNKVPEELVRERILPGSGAKVKQWGPFVYGYNMTVGPDGKPQIREFGNIKPETQKGRSCLDIKDEREPLADVRTADNKVQVVIELPGVEKKDIKLQGTENARASKGSEKSFKSILVNFTVCLVKRSVNRAEN